MHKFLRSIGFGEPMSRERLRDLLTDVIMNSDERNYVVNTDGVMRGEFRKNFAGRMGIAVCGEFDENDKFLYEYYYPYLIGSGITTGEDISVERHAARDSYAGICDDVNVGISLIFYLQNMIPYVQQQVKGNLPVRGTTLTLSALASAGTIMMPIKKDEKLINSVKRKAASRNKLIEAAKKGNEDAIETLTLEDMDLYSSISSRIRKEDIYSIVESSFMPYGMECDLYSILGEITEMRLCTNDVSGEQVYLFTVNCNELLFDVCINAKDLYGEPAVGRRFKGTIWLQGFINFPDEE